MRYGDKRRLFRVKSSFRNESKSQKMAHNKGKRRLGLKNGEFPHKDVSRETSLCGNSPFFNPKRLFPLL